MLLTNLDAAESAFFARELEQIKAKSYDVLYAELRARKFIPASQEPAPSGAEIITYRQYDRVGIAKLISSYADDLPRADVAGLEFTSKVVALGMSYGYNLQEIRASAMANRPLPVMRAMAARRAIEEQIDTILASGNTATGITGFLNGSAVPAASVATVGGTVTWADKAATDPDRILADITDVVGDMVALTKGAEMPDTLLMPISQYMLIASTRLIDRDLTVLDFIKQSLPMLTTIDHWYRLTGAGSGQTDRMMIYKKSPEKVFSEVPQEFESLAIQERNLEFVVPCHARVGGTVIPYPLSMSYRDGI